MVMKQARGFSFGLEGRHRIRVGRVGRLAERSRGQRAGGGQSSHECATAGFGVVLVFHMGDSCRVALKGQVKLKLEHDVMIRGRVAGRIPDELQVGL